MSTSKRGSTPKRRSSRGGCKSRSAQKSKAVDHDLKPPQRRTLENWLALDKWKKHDGWLLLANIDPPTAVVEWDYVHRPIGPGRANQGHHIATEDGTSQIPVGIVGPLRTVRLRHCRFLVEHCALSLDSAVAWLETIQERWQASGRAGDYFPIREYLDFARDNGVPVPWLERAKAEGLLEQLDSETHLQLLAPQEGPFSDESRLARWLNKETWTVAFAMHVLVGLNPHPPLRGIFVREPQDAHPDYYRREIVERERWRDRLHEAWQEREKALADRAETIYTPYPVQKYLEFANAQGFEPPWLEWAETEGLLSGFSNWVVGGTTDPRGTLRKSQCVIIVGLERAGASDTHPVEKSKIPEYVNDVLEEMGRQRRSIRSIYASIDTLEQRWFVKSEKSPSGRTVVYLLRRPPSGFQAV